MVNLVLKIKKKDIYVVDGIINYRIDISSSSIRCPCNSNNETVCKHVSFMLEKYGIDKEMMYYWTKIENDVLTQLRTGCVDTKSLWGIIKDRLEQECAYCLVSLYDTTRYDIRYSSDIIHICKGCKGFLHERCFQKWDKKKTGCMLCRGGSQKS